MDRKKLTYVLVALALAVWANIFYRIFFYVPDTVKQRDREDFISPAFVLAANDSFSIHSGYRDPFLGALRQEPVRFKALPKKEVPKVPVKSESLWPGITYTGMIRNQKSLKQLAMVVINGQSNLMQPGDAYRDITLNKVYKDSIVVSLGNMKKTVLK